MRYSVRSPDYEYTLLAVMSVNGKAVKEAPNCNQLFCELTENQIRLLRNKGLSVTLIKRLSVADADIPRTVEPSGAGSFSGADIAHAAALDEVRNVVSPPLKGIGQTIAVLDSGIRVTHQGFGDRVVYNKNFSVSPTTDDILSHGTPVAWLAAGGVGEGGREQGVAPECSLLNIKVLNDDGEGDEETVILAIDHVLSLKIDPLVINLSLGAPDDGDFNNPLREACRAAYEQGVQVSAAAGNGGPDARTILMPAVDSKVFAIGSLDPTTFKACSFSSRGPTLEGIIKPDLMFYGDDLHLANGESDTGYSIVAGTSFAVAGFSGIAALAKEAVARFLGKNIPVPGTSINLQIVGGLDWTWEYVPGICVKPEGAPADKDNVYGWGMPMGKLILQSFSPLAASGEMLKMVMPLMLMVMMMGMLMPIMRSS